MQTLKTSKFALSLLVFATMTLVLASCYTEDPGPLQQTEKTFDRDDFDRIEMGDAFVVKVTQGSYFSVSARGDERNIDDLEVKKEGSTLVIRFDDNHNRKHQTFIDITMPSLREANFSGATSSVIRGFDDEENVRITLSGASVSQAEIDASNVDVLLSGASTLTLTGSAANIVAGVSGASAFKGYNFPVDEASVIVSGASSCKVNVDVKLNAVASGASAVTYIGSPAVTSEVSGGSTVRQD